MNVVDELNLYFGTEAESIQDFIIDFQEEEPDQMDQLKAMYRFLYYLHGRARN